MGQTLILGLLLGPAVAAEPDWAALRQETADLLAAYLRVDTTNPPGSELAGARFLAAELKKDGIVAEVDEFLPGRANLVARVAGTGELPPLCLLSHLDVVPAEAGSWPADRPPLGGVVADGAVWGRGALDMKGMGALEVQVLRLLARQKVPLKRDVVLLAVADEEVDNLGMRRMVERWDQIRCSHLINEGGLGLTDVFFEGETVFPVSVGEKGVLWGQLIASGEPGHGSTPLPDTSIERLHQAMERLYRRKAKPNWHPTLFELLAAAGEQHGGFTGRVLRKKGMVKLLVKPRLMKNPLTRAALTDTVNLTGVGGAMSPNVVPGESWVNLDARLLPGTTPDEVEAEILRLVKRVEGVRFERSQAFEAQVSPYEGDPVYQAIVKRVPEFWPGAAVGPVVSVGFTDSVLARPLGVRAYGFVPFVVSPDQARSMHGNGEHVSLQNLETGLKALYQVVLDVSAVGG